MKSDKCIVLFATAVIFSHLVIFTNCQYAFEEEGDNEYDEESESQQSSTIRPPTVSPATVKEIFNNVNQANLTGIIDQALGLAAPERVRELVNNIMSTIFQIGSTFTEAVIPIQTQQAMNNTGTGLIAAIANGLNITNNPAFKIG